MHGSSNRICFFTLLLCLICRESPAQNHYVFFYNVENLFDYFDDPHTKDESFTPKGDYHWTKERFNTKIRMIYKAIFAGCEGHFPDIIGLAEVENTIYRLAVAVKKIQRRANALKNVLIPRLEANIRFIENSLEEKEREDFSRLKLIKK
jgi:predicted extracellular nuclease